MAIFKDTISNLIGSQVPDFVLEDHPKFLKFLETYYSFMEAAELVVTGVETTDGFQLESETDQVNFLVLDGTNKETEIKNLDENDKILLESSVFGKFTRGEIVQGQTSKATSTLLAEDLDNNKLFVVSQNKFIKGEVITGLSSNASAVLNRYRPNPVNNIQELLNLRDPDNTISDFLSNFVSEFLNTLPQDINAGVDKRKLIKNIKSLYQLKGTKQGHQLFFRLMFNEESDTILPRDNLLRVSDGNWDLRKIIRVLDTQGNTSFLQGRTITGLTSGATAIVESVLKSLIVDQTVSEITLNLDTLNGNFIVGEIVRGTETDDSENSIKAVVTGLLTTNTITNRSALYSEDDNIAISGGGKGASLKVKTVGNAPLTEIIIDQKGLNYTIGDELVFNNSGTNGGGAAGFISVVNGGFTLEDSTSTTEDHIVLENETTSGDIYSGDKIIQESSTGVGDITDIFVESFGFNYKSLPIISINSATGVGGTLLAYGNSVGNVKEVKVIEAGYSHESSPSPPTVTFNTNLIIKETTGTFIIDDIVTSGIKSGKIVSYNLNTQLLVLKNVVGTFSINDVITTTLTGATGKIIKTNVANATFGIGSIFDTDGRFLNEEGSISENTMKIQDSLYYQDFSYVLKVARSISNWRDAFKKTMHTAGFYFAGLVEINSRLDAKIKVPVFGPISGVLEEPFLAILNTIFTTILGRRLGTPTDGTTVRANPLLGAPGDLDTSTISPFASTTRDVTLFSPLPINLSLVTRPRGVFAGVQVVNGFGYTGPRYGTINREVLRTFTYSGTNYSLEELGKNTTIGTRTILDHNDNTLLFCSTDLGRLVKTRLTMPAFITIIIPLNQFDNSLVTFDQLNDGYNPSNPTITFDDTTP